MGGLPGARRVLVLLVVLIASLPHGSTASTTFVVNTTADGEGPCTSDHCTLREAIQAANSLAGADVITFSIPGSGPHTIQLVADLPAIVDPLTVDGSSEPDFGGTPVIEVDGGLVSEPGAYASAFRISAGPSTIKNLAINDFAGGDGIVVAGFSPIDNVVIQGNFIGTDVTGQTDQGNFIGIGISGASNVLVGGDEPHERNVISGNYQGLYIGPGAGSGTRIQGNYIGTTVSGTQALGNEGDGIRLDGSQYLIGGTTAGTGNVIAANGAGISVVTTSSQDNVIQGNLIGVGSTRSALGNRNGIIIAAGPTRNIVGGSGAAANVIAHNDGIGILVQDATGNTFTTNSVHSNRQLGIDLIVSSFQGRTPNDMDDPDTGSNDLQNYPVIESAVYTGTMVTIGGRINTTPNSTQRLEFFANALCDPSGHGEGETFLGATDVSVGAEGDATFSVSYAAPAGAGGFITSTATNPSGSTSEFSNCFDAAGTPAQPTPTPTPTPTQPTPTPTPIPTATTSRSPSPSASPTTTGSPSPSPSPSGSPVPRCMWSRMASAANEGSPASLLGVTTLSDSRAWAVGYSADDRGQGRTLVERWNGSTWNRVSTPNHRGEHNELNDVEVAPNGDVWAVGHRSRLSMEAIVLRYNGSDWKLVRSPSPGVELTEFSAVDVTPNGTVYAVGSRWDRDRVYHSVIARRRAGRWKVIPKVGGTLLHDVVAVGNRNVWAVGQRVKDGVSRTFILHYDGERWTSVPSPNVNQRFHILRGVTAVGSHDLWAVGSYFGDRRRTQPLILHFDGSRWTVADVPDVAEDADLYAVSAAASDDAVAVGQGGGTDPRVILEWDGTTWTRVPHDDVETPQLWDVDLSPEGDAWVVGSNGSRPFDSYIDHRSCE